MALKKELGLLEVFCISSGAMISSGLFILPALAYAKTGPSVILAYLLASIMVIPTVLAAAELTTAMPKSGGIYFFIDRSMGPMMGALGGLADWLSLAFKSAFALLGMGIFLVLFNPGFTMFHIKLIAIAFCLFFAAINIRGVKLAGVFQVIIVIALIVLLVLYVATGIFSIQFSRYVPFVPMGVGSVFATAGLVFISFAGLTKIAAVAGEVKNPGRNLPLGMFLSWSIISIIYVLVIFVTVGLVDPVELPTTLIPISLGGEAYLGLLGFVIMGVAALLAFISTGNAGVLTASRSPMAMGKDGLLPPTFEKLSKYGTPWFSILFTTAFMILVIVVLDLENFVKTASTLILILYIFTNLSLIFMRESNMHHYRPKYKAPFYPWAQVIGIIIYIFLIFEMGFIPLVTVGIFTLCGLGWYFFYAHGKIKREYALLYVVERAIGIKTRDNLLEEELRAILLDRGDITEKRFKEKIKNCAILDIDYFVPPAEFAKIVAKLLSERLNVGEDTLYARLLNREKDSNIVVRPGFAVISFYIKGNHKFEMVLVRTKKGALFSDESGLVHAAFIVVSSPDEQSFYFHSLMWLIQIEEQMDFDKEWTEAKDDEELRQILLSSWEKRDGGGVGQKPRSTSRR
ncbi:MAG: amino acid permease [Candidatus Thermoplasmatota archaeon]|nr:amino acid permease [Euryarchaeota archaeon]MBU4031276.1 amino acid permease [Candidatus Thermoplasmatota archaeon]MBU4071649.1 amino acid permease [Candidatus Thermoplasmatota archaeon]MBU4143455.1 amino acid permease [Candidatus Thermoplasmatota archaeon]MBU4592645.1 amino acid permease [Candidatus Thermoplasmatota archaeon]